MILKNEVLKIANSLNLRPDTIEKDYVLGWILFGINQVPKISKWAFKGGTSLKKCFFETFRFSEDLDFTLLEKSHLTKDFLLDNFCKVADLLTDEVGIDFFKDKFKFKIIDKTNGKYSAQGKIHYNGPLRRKHKTATIKLDLTTDEALILKTIKKEVHHPYTDRPIHGIQANCYAFEEVIAEKIRALAQRARPRDLYDVIHFFRNREMISNPKLVFNVLRAKCIYKQIDVPTLQHIIEHEKLDELKPQWENMLAHQLPHLPPMESFWNYLAPFFDWLYGQLVEKPIMSLSNKDEKIFQPSRNYDAYTINSVLYKIQFAAANRVCIELKYNNKVRTVEPLSFRKTNNGNRLFYGYEQDSKHPKAYTLSKIQFVEITDMEYIEKYPVEINSSGYVSMPTIRRKSIKRSEPKYKYQCPVCNKYFYRKKNNSKLNPHKNKEGKSCFGRNGNYMGYG